MVGGGVKFAGDQAVLHDEQAGTQADTFVCCIAQYDYSLALIRHVADPVSYTHLSPGRTFSCIGTSAWVATTSEKPLFDEEMRTFTWAHIVPGLYSPTGTMQAGGSSYNWLKGQVAKYETAVAKVQGISPYDLINACLLYTSGGGNELRQLVAVDARGVDDLLRPLEGVQINACLLYTSRCV